MKFAIGDWVEVTGGRTSPTVAFVRPGIRGVIAEYVGAGFSIEGLYAPHWYRWVCDGRDIYSQEEYLRKVPSDDQAARDFDWRALVTTQPEIA